ncbi:hypothetical protein NB640_01075 [Oxalobacter vibrioformis]|uniref:Uncharacterized protein n=1 Tax=Oxalobacter vibrioformis TaxID=933080 RepID=A0A9E9P3J4_9BURK|nr:hypothetical protein [Oxalobacter vibrioformis]WAW10290.1 hypothetical protein NB640_01075 [Oxalobacter vibrioformis]
MNPAEQDLVNIAGKFTESAKNTYTRENLINAADAIHQGETRHNEAAYRHPPRSDDVLTSLHAADTWGVEETIANPDSNTTKGFENSLRGINLSLQELRLMGNKLIDPDGRHLDTKGLQQWVDQENAWLNNNKVIELIDFRKLDWRKDPEKFIELGGKYFRESLLSTHLFGYAVDVIKGQGVAGVGEFFGTVAGIARFYNKTDELMGSILAGGALASADICWDRVVDGLSHHLPPLSRQALLFANSVMSEEVKARAFEWMKAKFLKDRKSNEYQVQSKTSRISGKGVNETGQRSDVPDLRESELDPITIRDQGSRR